MRNNWGRKGVANRVASAESPALIPCSWASPTACGRLGANRAKGKLFCCSSCIELACSAPWRLASACFRVASSLKQSAGALSEMTHSLIGMVTSAANSISTS